MHAKDRWAFLREFTVGMVILASMYFFLTAYRDYRDNYGIEILQELGLGDQAGIFSKTEIPIAFGVLLALSLLCLIRSNRVSLIFAFILMTSGQILMGVSTWMLQNDMLDGIQCHNYVVIADMEGE